MADDLERVGAVAAASLDRDGFAVVRGALSASVVEGFVTQIVAELALAEGTTGESVMHVAHVIECVDHCCCMCCADVTLQRILVDVKLPTHPSYAHPHTQNEQIELSASRRALPARFVSSLLTKCLHQSHTIRAYTFIHVHVSLVVVCLIVFTVPNPIQSPTRIQPSTS